MRRRRRSQSTTTSTVTPVSTINTEGAQGGSECRVRQCTVYSEHGHSEGDSEGDSDEYNDEYSEDRDEDRDEYRDKDGDGDEFGDSEWGTRPRPEELVDRDGDGIPDDQAPPNDADPARPPRDADPVRPPRDTDGGGSAGICALGQVSKAPPRRAEMAGQGKL